LALLVGLFILLAYYLFNSNSIIQKEFQRQLDSKYNDIKYEIKNYEKAKADSLLKEWQTDNEVGIRRNAIAINSSRITSEISDETSIFSESFSFNPRDIKFIGKFIDLIVFDGAAEENEVSIYFLEVNRKNSHNVSECKTRVRNAIDSKSYNWEEINI
jgi:predicted Holliday junction resolvase-like endonuclease